MKTMLTPLPQKLFHQKQSVKCMLTLSMLLTLSACGSIQYNGFSNADTIADLFSFTEPEASASSENAEETAQIEGATKPPQVEANDTKMTNETVLAEASQADSASEVISAETQSPATQDAVAEQTVVTEAVAKQAVVNQVAEIAPVIEIETETQISAPVKIEQGQVSDTTQLVAKVSETEQVDQNSQLDSAAIEEVNRLTEENPTAAISSDYQVLPEVQADVAEISVPNEILLLAAPAEYRPEVSEYGMWEIAKGDDSLYRENCTLASSTMQVSFDNYSTQVWLTVVGDDLLVNSTTNIDISRPRVGIKLDNGSLQPFSKKHFNTSAVWSGNLQRALQSNKSLSVALTGNELGGRIQEVTVELDDLKRAYSEYTKCNATTRIGSL